MKIGIATCADKPNLTVADQNFAFLLEERGFETAPLIWDEPQVLKQGWDAIVLRSVWDYHHRSQEFLNWLARIQRTQIQLINSPEVVRWNVHKSYLLDIEKMGPAIVPTLVFQNTAPDEEILEKVQQKGWSDLVLKPAVSATAFLTFQVAISSAELLSRIGEIKKHSDLIVQPFISSVVSQGEVSLIFFNDQKTQYSHAVIKRPQFGDFRVQSDFGGQVQGFQPSTQLLKFAYSCVDSIQREWTFVRVDIVDWEQSPMLSELEVIEPDLFLSFDPKAGDRFADAVVKKLKLTH